MLATQGSWHFLPMIPYFVRPGAGGGAAVGDRRAALHHHRGRRPDRPGRQARRRASMRPRPGSVRLQSDRPDGRGDPRPGRAGVAGVPRRRVLLAARRSGAENADRLNGAWAGALFGFALSAGTWPVILLPDGPAADWRAAPVQPRRGRRRARVLPGHLPLVVRCSWSNMLNVARYLGERTPVVGEWGWTAWMTDGNWTLAPMAAKVGQLDPVLHPRSG